MKINKLLSTIICATLVSIAFIGCRPDQTITTTIGSDSTQVAEAAEAIGLKTDVVVIGAGGGGLSAAIEAHDAGANVIIVEKMPLVGGNTARATAGINAAGSVFQKAAGIEDSPELHYADAMKGGENKNDPELLKYMTTHAADAIDWLTELGADVSEVSATGGASVKRTHRPVGGGAVGNNLVEILYANTEERNIQTMLETKATEILYEDGVVKGIKAVDKNGNEIIIHAESVVIASGGFDANENLYTKYQPQLKGFVTTNQLGATGDGIIMAEAIGADLTDIEEIQIHPTVHQATASLITEGVCGGNALCDIIVFGRQAGINASKFAMADGTFIGASATSETEETGSPKISEEAKAIFKDGVYTGEATGNNGKIAVEVIVKPNIIYSQTTEGVDAVTGVTNSSNAMFEAVNSALEKAK